MTIRVATVRAADVPASQTNFPIYVDLARVGATALTLADAQSSRWYTDTDLVTQMAREIMSLTEGHGKYGTLTSTSKIAIDYDGIRADYAVTDTFGRNNVWTDYTAVYHLEANSNDSKGTYNGTDTSISYSAAKIANGASFNADSDRISLGNNTAFEFGEANSFTIQTWYNATARAANDFLFSRQDGSGGAGFRGYSLYVLNTSGDVRWDMYSDTGGGGNNTRDWSATIAANATQYMLHLVSTGTSTAAGINLYRNASLQTATTTADTLTGSTVITREFQIGNRDANNLGANGLLDEFRVRASALSANWITTEYNNQNAESTFWGTWATVGGGFTPTPLMHMRMMAGGMV